MSINLETLQRTLAENKVYDAWPYVHGLGDAMRHMCLSIDLAKAVYNHRKNEIEHFNQSIRQEMGSSPGTEIPIALGGLKSPFQEIAGIAVDDTILMEKMTIEFFHYARVSVDIVNQIINSALFGDDAEDEEDVAFRTLSTKLGGIAQFGTLKSIMDNASNNDEFVYMREFDNYTKHINMIPFSIKNSMFFGNKADFIICGFSYRGNDYLEYNAIDKMETVMNETENYIDKVLTELINQVPNATGTSSRYHRVSFISQIREHDKKSFIDYVVYYLEVENGITDLPSKISILPLVIKPNGEIEDHRLDMDKLFITKKGEREKGICGMAEVDPDQNKAALYRKYIVRPASIENFYNYLSTFRRDYDDHKFQFKGMEGSFVMYKTDEASKEEDHEEKNVKSE